MADIWTYLHDRSGSFSALNADHTSRLYFPLMNEAGLRSSVTPDLKGDISGGFDRYLTPPVVTEDLHRTLNARYVWITADNHEPWSVNGLSPSQVSHKWGPNAEESNILARPGSFTLTREHPGESLKVSICLSVPATEDQVELWKITVQNTGSRVVGFTPWLALPLYGRHADHIRDHRQVTTMFQKCYKNKAGVSIRPAIVHDETGHKVNDTTYFAFYFDESGNLPDRIWARMQDFIGEGGALNHPKAIFLNEAQPETEANNLHGSEAISAASFTKQFLQPGESRSFVAVVGLTRNNDCEQISSKYQTAAKFDHHLEKTHTYWDGLTSEVDFSTGRPDFDEWTRWLAFQLKCRQIFGNSFLPDFGYGRGGRGWRDLWQDLLSIFLVDPESATREIVQNLKGIRIDGSNATIIGNLPGEFRADRNNIPRSWCDHGAWPLYAVNFYIQQTGHYEILWEKIPYWKDRFVSRSKNTDELWKPEQGNWQRQNGGSVYESTLFEHLLVQQLSAFFHVGEHNILLLEGADWNDTLDMARNRGESVCFQNFYVGNLDILITWLENLLKKDVRSVDLLKEMTVLLDRTMDQTPVDYEKSGDKRKRLDRYFHSVSHEVSGQLEEVQLEHLLADLKIKKAHSLHQIRNNEWVSAGEIGFFNGHYNDRGEAMHGAYQEGWRMDLTSQVMPVMFDVASDEQTNNLYAMLRKTLSDGDTPGLRLCSPFPEVDMQIGRITGFSYGFKEHGSKWMQQNIMLMYGLYKRNHLEKAWEMFQDVYALSQNSGQAKTFPGVPSYFEPDDRGAYMYLTGSSTWLYLTLVTQIFGIRGINGNLLIHPKLSNWFFNDSDEVSLALTFRKKRLDIRFRNPKGLPPEGYRIQKISVDGNYTIQVGAEQTEIAKDIIDLFNSDTTVIVVNLG